MSILCDEGCTPLPEPSGISLKGPDGEVSGTATLRGGDYERFALFQPDAPLTAGKVYWLTVTGAHFIGDLTPSEKAKLVPTPALTWSAPPAVTDRVVAIERARGKLVCCSGPLDSCEGAPCFNTEIQRIAAVQVGWDNALVPAGEGDQYEFRIIQKGAREAP